MKLVTKIFLQVFAGFLILSQVLFFYLLNETKNENLLDVYVYEEETFKKQTNLFYEELNYYDLEKEEVQIQEIAARNAFHGIFGIGAALYRDGREIYNETPYVFDSDGILNRPEGRVSYREYGERAEKSDLLIGETEGDMLMFFHCAGEEGSGFGDGISQYQIIWYKDVTDIFVRTGRLARNGLIFTMGMLLVMGSLFLCFLRRTMRPLVKLKTAAAAIAAGDYESRVSVNSKDEIGQLAGSFNLMAEQIETHVEQLTQTNESQKQLIAGLAHELKTPMTAIIGYSDTLLNLQLKEEQKKKALGYIGSECRRLSRLSVKMMELTGLYQTGDKSVKMETVRIAELLQQLTDLTAYRLQEKQIRMQTECEPEKLEKKMDRDLMLSLLMNLVDNACKASKVGGKLLVRADEEGISVQDDGKGIPAEEISRVTEAFYMVDKSRARNRGSVGLGLALCKRIADIHGGELEIESEVGRGTRVRVRFG